MAKTKLKPDPAIFAKRLPGITSEMQSRILLAPEVLAPAPDLMPARPAMR
jgi:hypothetical protein